MENEEIKNTEEYTPIPNINFNLTGDIISKTPIWRTGTQFIKQQLIEKGCKYITFPNFMDKENKITLIDNDDTENKVTYEIKDIVNHTTKEFSIISSYFIVEVTVTHKGSEQSELAFNVTNFTISENTKVK